MYIYAFSVSLPLPSVYVMFLYALFVFLILPLIYVKSPSAFSAFLRITSIFIIVCRCVAEACNSLLQSWQSSWKESRNMQRKGIHFPGRGQQEREDTKGKTHSDVAGSMDTRTSTQNSDRIEGPAQAKHVKRIQSGWPKVLKSLCELATLWACLQLPTVAAAYEIKIGVDMTDYGTISSGMIPISIRFVLTVYESVQINSKNIRDCGRGFLAKLGYMVWVIVGLLSMVMVLAPAINDDNGLEAGDDVTKVLYLVFAIFFAALVPRMRGTCRVCKKATCTCPNGPGGGSGASLEAAATYLDIEKGTSH